MDTHARTVTTPELRESQSQRGAVFVTMVASSSVASSVASSTWSRGVVRPVLKKCHFVVEMPFLRYFFEAENASKVTPF